MRPELNHRFCGRCGEACGGFAGASPIRDGARLCAACTVERMRHSFWWDRVLAVILSLCILAVLCPALLLILAALAVGGSFIGAIAAVGIAAAVVYAGLRTQFSHEEDMLRMIAARDGRPRKPLVTS